MQRELESEMVPSECLKKTPKDLREAERSKKPQATGNKLQQQEAFQKEQSNPSKFLAFSWLDLQGAYSPILRSFGFNLPSLPLTFRLCFLLMYLASTGTRFNLHKSGAMNWKRIPLITVTKSVNVSFLSSSLSLQSLDLSCVASL